MKRSTAELAQLEVVARRFVLSQLEAVRGDGTFSDEVAVHALAELLVLVPGRDSLKDAVDEDWMQVVWFLSFFAAAGALAEADGKPDEAIEAVQKRLVYLASLINKENS